jgi:MFS family permease
MRTQLTGLWRQPDFLRLWSGQTISVLGSIVGGTALEFTAILVLHATPAQMALLAAANLVPGILTGLAAGAWIDRLRRRPLMIGADLGRAALLATIPLAALLGLLRIEHLVGVALLTGLLALTFDVAYQSYLPTLVLRDNLVEGNSKMSASSSVAEVSGFAVAGWLVQLLSAPMAILIDAFSFVVSAISIGMIRTAEPPPLPIAEREGLRREIVEGIWAVLGNPILRALAGSTMTRDLSLGMIGTVYLLFVSQELGFPPGILGTIFGIGGITSLLGAVLAGRVTRLLGFGPVMIYTLVIAGLTTMVVGLAQGVTIVSVLLLVTNQLFPDPSLAIYEINQLSLRQTITPDRLLGRVNASVRFAGLAAMLVGTLLGGVLGEMIGVRATLILGSGISVLAALWLAGTPIRGLKVAPGPVAVQSSAA